MNDNLPPMPPCAPEFKPRWPNDPGGYTADQMKAYARAALSAAPQPQPVQEPVQEPVATVIKKGSERQWMSERLGRFPDGIYSLYTSPQAHPLSDGESPISVLLAVEESIKNGECPWQIEQAFDEYEAQRQSAITKGTT